jgi:hypothetical protein
MAGEGFDPDKHDIAVQHPAPWRTATTYKPRWLPIEDLAAEAIEPEAVPSRGDLALARTSAPLH